MLLQGDEDEKDFLDAAGLLHVLIRMHEFDDDVFEQAVQVILNLV